MTKAWILMLNLVACKLKLNFFQGNKKVRWLPLVMALRKPLNFILTYSFKGPLVEACSLLLYLGNSHNLKCSAQSTFVLSPMGAHVIALGVQRDFHGGPT